MISIEMREGGITVSANRVRIVALVNLGVNRNRTSACTDDLTVESNDVTDKQRITEIDAMLN